MPFAGIVLHQQGSHAYVLIGELKSSYQSCTVSDSRKANKNSTDG